jgi:hypothetical protein
MKARVQHLVPLSRQALELLDELKTLVGDSEYLFPLIRDSGRPLYGSALSCALQSVGFDREEATVARLQAMGHEFIRALSNRSLYFCDYDDHVFELDAEDIDKELGGLQAGGSSGIAAA